MMTRKEIIKSLQRTLSAYEKKGYSFDLDLSSMSTQKLVSLRKYKGDDLIKVIAQRHPESNVAKIQAIKTEEKSRERVIKGIERKLSKYKQEGWDIEIKREELEKMSLIELRNLSKSGKMGIAEKYGFFYTFKSGESGDKVTTITAKEAVEMEKLWKRAEFMRRMYKADKEKTGKPYFTTKKGKEYYLDYLRKAGTAEYWKNLEENAASNLVKALRKRANLTEETKFMLKPLLDYLGDNAHDSDVIAVIRKFEVEGKDWDIFRYLYDSDDTIEDKIASVYAEMGLTDMYNKRLEQANKIERDKTKPSRIKIKGKIKDGKKLSTWKDWKKIKEENKK